MGKIRNVSPEDLHVSGYGEVERDAVIEVPDSRVYGFTVSGNWEPADKPAQVAHDDAEKVDRARVAKERGEKDAEE